jgi:FMN phosphatase YigB (HAD superfamily)
MTKEPLDPKEPMMKKILFLDMDNVLVDFPSGIARLNADMTGIGYKVDLMFVHCPIEQAVQWNLNRSDDAISAYFAEPFQHAWLMEAAQAEGPQGP